MRLVHALHAWPLRYSLVFFAVNQHWTPQPDWVTQGDFGNLGRDGPESPDCF